MPHLMANLFIKLNFFSSPYSKTSFFLPSESEEWESFEPNEFIPPAPTSSNQSTPKNSKNQIPESTNMIPSNSGIVGIPDRKYRYVKLLVQNFITRGH